jgi:tetratricopeptide (TPR) repeat protein
MRALCGLLLGVLLAQPLAAQEDLIISRSAADGDYAAGRFAEAAKGYEIWLKQRPNDEEGWFRLGNSYNELLRPMEALVAYRRAQQLKPQDGRPWHNMGMLYLRLAIESYDNLRRNVPKNDPLVPYSEKVLSGILDLISLRLQKDRAPPLKDLAPKK